MHGQTSVSSQTPSNGNLANGSAAAEMDRLLADLRGLVQHLLQERENLRQSVQRLEQERDCLRQTVANLEEKCKNYAPVVIQWAKGLLTPEEAEVIVSKNDWIRFEEVMAEL